MDLPLQESGVLSVNLLDLILKSPFFSFVILFIARPNVCLLVSVGFEICLASLFLFNLPGQKFPHLFLLSLCSISLPLFFSSKSHFTVHFVAQQHLVLFTLLLGLVLDHSTAHSVHELLGSALSCKEFALTILLLLFKNLGMLLLGSNI
jgi:hypothetical protein